MRELKYFNNDVEPKKLDRTPFGFSHKLANHPLLSIEYLAGIISEMPKEKILLSKGLNDLNLNFDKALDVGTRKLNVQEMIENILTSDSYVAIKNPEVHPAFKDLYLDLIADVSKLLQINQTGKKPINPYMWIFIASPNAVTPFHFDRTSNFIMQIRGSKELAIFPPRREEIISAKDTESYLDWTSELPRWNDELDKYAHKFNFKSGEAAHIPFVSGHYIKNGAEDISITLSIFFHSDETYRWSNAMKLNNRLRRLGIRPNVVGNSRVKDSLKAGLFPAVDRAFKVVRKLRRH